MRAPRRRARAGFTLLEVMVSVAVLGMVTAYLTMMLVRQSESFEVVDEVTEIQQNLRAIGDLLEREIRTTGFMVTPSGAVCGIDGDIGGSDMLFVTDADAINPANQESPELGASITAGYPGTTLTLSDAQATLDSAPFYDNDNPYNGVADSDFYYVLGGPAGGVIVADRNNPDRGTQCGLLTDVRPGVTSSQIEVDWTVGGRVAAPTALAVRLPGSATPDLVAIPANFFQVVPGAGPGEAPRLFRNGMPIADDVEDLQVAYLHDNNEDGIEGGCVLGVCERTGDAANAYDASGTDNTYLREVRFSFVVRTASQDIDSQTLVGANKDFGRSQQLENGPAAGAADGFRRRVYTRSVRPRNIGIR